ncbi:MAG: hypothetical protein WCF84_05565 [Anaerolineae bacterium]
MDQSKRQANYRWILSWVITTVVGTVIGWGLSNTLFLIFQSDPKASVMLQELFRFVVTTAMAGITMSIAQSFALRGSTIRATEWVIETTASWVFALLTAGVIVVLSWLAAFLAISRLYTFPTNDEGWTATFLGMYMLIGSIFVGWLVLGLALGWSQAWFLRRRLGKSTWWRRATAIGWTMGWGIAALSGPVAPIILALVYGTATGIAMERILSVGREQHAVMASV